MAGNPADHIVTMSKGDKVNALATLDRTTVETTKEVNNNYLDDEFWQDNPNALTIADATQIEACYDEHLGDPDADIAAFYDAVIKQPPPTQPIDVLVAASIAVHKGQRVTRRRRLFTLNKPKWLIFLKKQKANDPARRGIPVKLTEEEHKLLMYAGVIPAFADERDLNCAERRQVKAVRSGTFITGNGTVVPFCKKKRFYNTSAGKLRESALV